MSNVIQFPESRIIRRTSITYESWSLFTVIKKLFVKPAGMDTWERWHYWTEQNGKSGFWGPADLFDSVG